MKIFPGASSPELYDILQHVKQGLSYLRLQRDATGRLVISEEEKATRFLDKIVQYIKRIFDSSYNINNYYVVLHKHLKWDSIGHKLLNEIAGHINSKRHYRYITIQEAKRDWPLTFLEGVETGFFPSLEPVSLDEVGLLEGHLVNPNPKYPLPTLINMARQGFCPVCKFSLDNATYYISQKFTLPSLHTGVVAFVKIGDKVTPRVFYQSASQATWRVMPFASKEEDGKIIWFGKGHSESDTQLPIPLIVALQTSELKTGKKGPVVSSPLVRTVAGYRTGITDSYQGQVRVIDAGVRLDVGEELMSLTEGVSPGYLRIPEHLNFDFQHLLCEKNLVVPEYGNVTARIFQTENHTHQILIYEAEDGRAFIGAIEKVKDNPITTFGIRETAYKLEGMDAPLLEYGNRIDEKYRPKSGHPPRYSCENWYYSNNWNYVREIPLIQAYYKAQGRDLPGLI